MDNFCHGFVYTHFIDGEIKYNSIFITTKHLIGVYKSLIAIDKAFDIHYIKKDFGSNFKGLDNIPKSF